MTEPVLESSPRLKARVAGAFYVLTFAAAFGLMARSRLVVRNDALATAQHILGAELLYRWSVVADLGASLSYVVVTVLLYDLLKPVNRTVSLLAAFFSLAGCAIGAASLIFLLAPLVFLGASAPPPAGFGPDQLQALAYASIRLHAHGFNIGQSCFGVYCILLGCLVWRSSYFPRLIGALLGFAGLGWLTGSLATLLAPAFARAISGYLLLPGLLGEGSLTLWLLIFGVDEHRWREQATRRIGEAQSQAC